MRVGIIGTGVVGQVVGGKLVSLGHEVMMGSRRAGNEQAVAWAAAAGQRASQGSFADAAAFGELLVNATAGTVSLEALRAAGAANLAGKVLVDISNPLDFSAGFPPSVVQPNDGSVGRQIQGAFPDALVVKTLNTVSNPVMVDPGLLSGSHVVFVCGDDAGAKVKVTELLQSFGWPAGDIVDLGDISAARAVEAYLELWVRLFGRLGTNTFNISLVRAV